MNAVQVSRKWLAVGSSGAAEHQCTRSADIFVGEGLGTDVGETTFGLDAKGVEKQARLKRRVWL